MWSLIKQIKKTRSIILSTQHIEEADELADQVTIMSHGKLIAKDTPWNIKKQFGVGYSLLLERKSSKAHSTGLMPENDLDYLIRSEIESAERSSDSSFARLIYFIPFELVTKLPNLLEEIETKF